MCPHLRTHLRMHAFFSWQIKSYVYYLLAVAFSDESVGLKSSIEYRFQIQRELLNTHLALTLIAILVSGGGGGGGGSGGSLTINVQTRWLWIQSWFRILNIRAGVKTIMEAL